MNWLNILVWRLTGWSCPAWNKRDNDGRIRYWTALVEARRIIDKALEMQ